MFFDFGENKSFWNSQIVPYLPEDAENNFIIDESALRYLNTVGIEALPYLKIEKNWNATLYVVRVFWTPRVKI